MLYYLTIFIIEVLLSSIIIWVASKFSWVNAEFKQIVVIVICVALISLVPYAGWLLGIIAFFYLLTKLTGCNAIDAIWVVLFTKLFSFILIFIIDF